MKRHVLLTELAILSFAFAPGPGRVSAEDLYVATNGTGNGSSWATATNSIQAAINAIDGTYPTNTVWVSNGVYEVGGDTNYLAGAGGIQTNRVAIYKAITVRSANNDPTNTIIKGAWNPVTTNGPAAVRCVYMTNGSSLIGFMLTNGATLENSLAGGYGAAGGIWCPNPFTSITISNCIIAGNSSFASAGGTWRGNLYNCTIIGNLTHGAGGGAYQSIMYNCALIGNACLHYGGGARDSILYNCTLTGNLAYDSLAGGGGLGGGTQIGSLYNCTLSNNWAKNYGGGSYQSTMYNCLVTSNASSVAGGAGYCTMYNCTIAGNTAVNFGGGTRAGTYYNCIIYSNTAPTDPNWFSTGNFTNSCTTPTNSVWAPGNTTNNPLFVNSAGGDYRLSKDSPGVNTGTNLSWMTDPADSRSKDLDRHSRIDKFSGKVDMGCYEYLPSGTIFSAR